MSDEEEEVEDEGGIKEAVCYGPLHPNGKVLEVRFFRTDADRPNNFAEFCKDCEAWDKRQKARGGFPVPPVVVVKKEIEKKGAGQMEAIDREWRKKHGRK
jgi:hypothetical protein